MWNKPAEGNVSPQSPNTTAQAPVATNVNSSAPPPAPTFSAPAATSSAPPSSGSPSTISAGLRIHGDFSGTADLYVDGEAQGSIRLTNAKVTVGPHGRVQADIEARDIVVEGTVQGNLKASESIRLGAGSRVQGSMMTPRIAIEDGARLRSKVEMTKPGDARRAAAGAQGGKTPAPAPALAPVAAAPVAKE